MARQGAGEGPGTSSPPRGTACPAIEKHRRDSIAFHRRWVTELLSWGRLVQQAAQQPEFPDKALAARVNTRVRHLQDKLALWHRDMAPAEEGRILHAAFA